MLAECQLALCRAVPSPSGVHTAARELDRRPQRHRQGNESALQVWRSQKSTQTTSVQQQRRERSKQPKPGRRETDLAVPHLSIASKINHLVRWTSHSSEVFLHNEWNHAFNENDKYGHAMTSPEVHAGG